METAIFFECLLIILLLGGLLLRQRTRAVSDSKWLFISEAFTQDIWNETVDLEHRFQQNPLFQILDEEDDLNNLRVALEQSTQLAIEVGEGIRQRSFYGVPVPIEAYCSRASRWYFDMAHHYEACARDIEMREKNSTSRTKGAIIAAAKGAIGGYLGGLAQVFSMLAEQDSVTDTPQTRRTETLHAKIDRLNYTRTYLDSERESVQAFLGAMFNWKFDENA